MIENHLVGTLPVIIIDDGAESHVGPVSEDILSYLSTLTGRTSSTSALWLNHETGDLAYVANSSRWLTPGHQGALCSMDNVEKAVCWLRAVTTLRYNLFAANDDSAARAHTLYKNLTRYN